jgi:SPP1 family predicted phage head-tail adaptor
VTNGAEDERGVPAQTWATLATVKGSVQPKSVQEVAQLTQGGPVVSDLTLFLHPTDLREGDRIIGAAGQVYQVDGVRDPAGAGHHLEVDVHLVEVS